MLTLDDWPHGAPSRAHAAHRAYLRAARRNGAAKVEYVRLTEVARRGKWTCTLCGGPVLREWDAGQLAHAPALTFSAPPGPTARVPNS